MVSNLIVVRVKGLLIMNTTKSIRVEIMREIERMCEEIKCGYIIFLKHNNVSGKAAQLMIQTCSFLII